MNEADNVPMLLQSSESAESSCSAVTKKKKFASIFIPTSSNRSFDYENQHVRQADSPQSVKKNPTVSITMRGLLTEKNNKEIEMTKKCPKEPEYRLSTGPLGMCDNNDYCMICPTYCRPKKEEMQDNNNRRYQTQQHDNQKLHDVQDGEPKRGTSRKLRLFIHQFIPGVVNPHSKFVSWWDRVFVISCFLATFVDPLFFFLLSVHQENKCIVFDWALGWVIMVIRSSTDLVYLLHMLLQFRLAYISPEARAVGFGVLIVHPKKIILNYLKRCFWIDLVIVLPLPQMMTMLVQTTLLLTSAIDKKNVLRYIVVLQYIPRLWRFLPILTGRSPNGNGLLFETAWANFVINLFSFVLAGHVVGSAWYHLGLQRVNQCLKEACDASHLGTNYTRGCTKLIDCGHVSKNKDAITNPELWRNYTGAISCFTADGFSYGIFLQQISTLAGNQNPSYFIWEVLFTMAIVGFGLLLFALLIGNMQNFLQALGRRRLDMMLRRRDFEQWMSHRDLSDKIKEKIRNAEKYHWMTNRGVDEETLMVNLPEDLRTEIQQYLLKQETTMHGITKERPVSKRTVSCITNVEAFVLGAEDLQDVTHFFAKFLTTPRVQKAIRFETISLAARRIQAAWRNYKKERQVQSKTAGISDYLIPFQKDSGSHSRL